MKRLLAIACTSLAVGCTTPQRDIAPEDVASLQEGRATVADVVGKLGHAPTSLVAGDRRRLIYYVGGATSLPGDEGPGANDGVRGGVVIFLFDGNDRLLSKTVPGWFLAQEARPSTSPPSVDTAPPSRVASVASGAASSTSTISAPATAAAASAVSSSASRPIVAAAATRPKAASAEAAASRPWWGFHIKFGGPDPGDESH